MAQNEVYDLADSLGLPVTSGVVSGDPVMVGNMPGVALQDRSEDTSGEATVKMRGAFTLSVKGANEAGNVAIGVGDPIFFTSADTPKLSAKQTGKFFGFALEAVGSGDTTAIKVRIARTGDARSAGIATGAIKVALADGTASATDVTVAAIEAGDELVSVIAFTTKASIASMNDRTSEYAIQAGGLDKAAGTNETNNQLLIIYIDRT